MKTKIKKLVPLNKLVKKTESVFNSFIRSRDCEGDWFVCINCGKTKPKDELQAGHLIPVSKSSFLRFHPDNVHGECSGCNAYDQAKVSYAMNLIKKIGLERVQWLSDNKRAGYKYCRTELDFIIQKYKL